jgi:hypothetical protein
MNAESLQKAYDEDAVGHPLLAEPDLSVPPIGLVRQLSGVNGGIQNNLVFGDNGIAKGFLSRASNIRELLGAWIIAVGFPNVLSDDRVNSRFDIIREFLMKNRFDNLYMLDEDMSKTAVRHVLWHLSLDLPGDHGRLYKLLKAYSPDRFGYEYGCGHE